MLSAEQRRAVVRGCAFAVTCLFHLLMATALGAVVARLIDPFAAVLAWAAYWAGAWCAARARERARGDF